MKKKYKLISIVFVLCKILFISVLLTACAKNEKLIYIYPDEFNMIKTEETKPVKIRMYAEDIKLYKAYIDALRNKEKFHNSQIDRYNEYLRAIKENDDE